MVSSKDENIIQPKFKSADVWAHKTEIKPRWSKKKKKYKGFFGTFG